MRRAFTSVLTAAAALACAAAAAQTPPYFTNVTAEAGLAGRPAFRLSVADLDGDGYPDILLHRQANQGTGDWFGKQSLLMNVPGGPLGRTYTDVTATSGIRDNRAGTATGRHTDGAVFADVDDDGDLDMFTMVYVHENLTSPTDKNDLMLNDGAGHFTLAPSSPFHTEILHNTAAAVFTDYDRDGNVDLYIGNWYRSGAMTPDQLYRGDGAGGFTNVSSSSGIASGLTSVYGIAVFDWNDDGFPDLFAPSYAWTAIGAVSMHWRNNGNGTFTRVEATTNYDDHRGFLSQVASFGSMPADFDNDGDQDFLEVLTHGVQDCAGFVHTTAVPNVAGVFSWDFGRVCGRAAEDPDDTHHGDHYGSWLDFDLDGLLDFALTESGYGNNRFYVFRQAAAHTFAPVTVASGLDEINALNLPPHNVIPLDFDLDGDEDLLVGFADDVTGLRLYRNDVGTANHWLVVTLEGAGGVGQANRSAIGAKVQVTAGGVTQTRELAAGNGHMGPQAPLRLHFGLGSATVADSVVVRWPNGSLTTTMRTAVPADQVLHVVEGCEALPGDPTGLRLNKDAADVLLSWDDPLAAGTTWNVYRDASPDPSTWGPPHAAGVTDADPLEPGIQHVDAGAIGAGPVLHYLVTAVDRCGESPLP